MCTRHDVLRFSMCEEITQRDVERPRSFLLARTVILVLSVLASTSQAPHAEELSAPTVRYETIPMLGVFKGEGDPNETADWCKGLTVDFLSESERETHRLTVQDGKIINADGAPFDTSSDAGTGSQSSRAIFIMTSDGALYASKHSARCKFHHSSFLAGAPVAAAGEIEVRDGQLLFLSNDSGHYEPPSSITEQALFEFERLGVDTRHVETEWIAY